MSSNPDNLPFFTMDNTSDDTLLALCNLAKTNDFRIRTLKTMVENPQADASLNRTQLSGFTEWWEQFRGVTTTEPLSTEATRACIEEIVTVDRHQAESKGRIMHPSVATTFYQAYTSVVETEFGVARRVGGNDEAVLAWALRTIGMNRLRELSTDSGFGVEAQRIGARYQTSLNTLVDWWWDHGRLTVETYATEKSRIKIDELIVEVRAALATSVPLATA